MIESEQRIKCCFLKYNLNIDSYIFIVISDGSFLYLQRLSWVEYSMTDNVTNVVKLCMTYLIKRKH